MTTTNALLLDSSIWIELFNSGPQVKACQKEMQSADSIIVPTLVTYEVYRKIASMTSEDQALSAVTVLTQYLVVDLTNETALLASDLSLQYHLGMADSIILAHTYQTDAKLITLDNDFSQIPNVKILRKSAL